jgi:16S rRNA (cytosine967-C5)-methyltransferase
LALEVLKRVDDDGAYANLALSAELAGAGFDQADRNFATDLVYGTVRMQRALDHEADQFLNSDPPPVARRALRLGVYQLRHRGDIPAYAAVSATVEATPKRFRGLLNAVLRKVSGSEPDFPDLATELSYPTWLVEILERDLGKQRAHDALSSMNVPARVHKRPDGYVQDLASQMVTEAVAAGAGEIILDACAAPGGKATGMASAGAFVFAGDIHEQRVGLIASNAQKLGLDSVWPLQMDAKRPPVAPGSLDAVLVDAPCSGLGVLRRRADARWRVQPAQIDRLPNLQLDILRASVPLLKPGGRLVYSVCTLTAAESTGVDERLAEAVPELVPMDPPEGEWQPWGRGAILLPDADHDGMCLFRYHVP